MVRVLRITVTAIPIGCRYRGGHHHTLHTDNILKLVFSADQNSGFMCRVGDRMKSEAQTFKLM